MKEKSMMMEACFKNKVDYYPVWLMRQAGRYMKSYQKLRERYSFVELCKESELAAEVTMQPIREMGVDAAIIFSDILFLLEGMGLKLLYGNGGEGPYIENPVRSEKDIIRLRDSNISTEFRFLLEAIQNVKGQLSNCIPLIGFSGSPWTLAAIAIQGSFKEDFKKAKEFMYQAPNAFKLLMNKIIRSVCYYLKAQLDAGADIIQIFDSLALYLSRKEYLNYSLSSIINVIKYIKAESNRNAPVIVYSRGANHSLSEISGTGCDVINIDTILSIREAYQITMNKVAIQGNLDPVVLLTSREIISEKVRDILMDAIQIDGFIFNLGHGVLSETPEDNVKFLVDYVHEESKKILNDKL